MFKIIIFCKKYRKKMKLSKIIIIPVIMGISVAPLAVSPDVSN
jgi:hypothetical protein